jgi:glycosyltransferase involved in cell wall biosynthesis
MKIAFISIRGIPNNYGGLEQFAERISVGLASRGHEVTVYSPHYHPNKEDSYKGVRIKHIYSPETWMGSSIGSFFYDFGSLRDALKNERFDIIYDAGYTSIVPAYIWFNIKKIKCPVFTTNMDGLEYKRSKFNRWVQRFLLWEEKMAVMYSHHLISDNLGIQRYLKEKYGRDSKFLAYGADIYENCDAKFLKEFSLEPYQYYLMIIRMVPENNIEMVIQGYLQSEQNGIKPLIIVGKTNTPFGKYLMRKYADESFVRFLGGIYDFDKTNSIRHFSYAYFHGHSVGGTNPSLLEAMGTECFILSHDNEFNRTVLNNNALYFSSAQNVASLLNRMSDAISQYRESYIANNTEEIRTHYSWEKLVDEHEQYFNHLISNTPNN